MSVYYEKNLTFLWLFEQSRGLDWGEGEKEQFEGTDIRVRGAINETIGTIDDAARLGKELPEKLSQINNSLKMVLLPVSLLDSKARRIVRRLDGLTVESAPAALEAAHRAYLSAEALCFSVKEFPLVEAQRKHFASAFQSCITTFRNSVRDLLPKLRDGESNTSIDNLQHAVDRMTHQTKITIQYTNLKNQETKMLASTVTSLLENGLDNYLQPGAQVQAVIGKVKPRILLSLAGGSINNPHHPLEKSLTCDDVDCDRSESEEEEEWFQRNSTVSLLQNSFNDLMALHRENRIASFEAEYGVGAVDRAIPAESTSEKKRKTELGVEKKRKTELGDLVLMLNGKVSTVSTCLPRPPNSVTLHCSDQTIHVAWNSPENTVLPPRSFRVLWRPRPNASLDSFDQCISENEPLKWQDVPAKTMAQGAACHCDIGPLSQNTDFEVYVQTRSDVGFSASSPPSVTRTAKGTTTALKIIAFHQQNESKLAAKGAGKWTEVVGGKKPWVACQDSLFLGLTTVAIRRCEAGSKYAGKLAAIMVDVAPEFQPDIMQSPQEEACVLMFTGPTGAGKSTEINAFVSFLLGGDLSDSRRIMLIDDREANQDKSVTQWITVYRLRPLTPTFQGKTLYIVDPPGYGDTDGPKQDTFITFAMSELFKLIGHFNAVVFACKAHENRAKAPGMIAVATHIFHLFSKDVRGCLRTILTHADAGKPQAISTLKALGWPVDAGCACVNNSAFRAAGAEKGSDPNVRDWWKMSMSGQKRVMDMLLRMGPVPTESSAQVTTQRMTLEDRCELAEKKIFRTAQETQTILAHMRAIADAVGASPGQKVKVENTRVKEERVPDGKKTTLCTFCHETCHEICALDDGQKAMCVAMNSSGHCTICKHKCHYSKHRNAQFILRTETYYEEIVPEELLKRWNDNNTSVEGALLGAMDKYLALQDELTDDIKNLAQLTETLNNIALLNDPQAFLNYLDMLIGSARARGASGQQLQALMSAKNTMSIAAKAASQGGFADAEPQLLADVTKKVCEEMKKRTQMSPKARAQEEEKPCNMYNTIYKTLPMWIQAKAPKPLATGGLFSCAAKYPENLKAIVKLMDVILKTGSVMSIVTK